MRTFFLATISAIVLASCASGPSAEMDVTQSSLSGEACPMPGQGGYLFWFDPPSREAGESVMLTPYFSSYPGMMEPLPGGCLGELSADPAEAVSFSRAPGGEPIATVTDQAKPGSRVMLNTVYAGAREISARLVVFDADANPLVGRWTQTQDESCPSGSRILELVFTGAGEFSVTWQPFEVYKDYWGSYTYNKDSGELTLTPESGNYIPETLMSGPVKVEGGLLTPQEGMSFGANRKGDACSAPFELRR